MASESSTLPTGIIHWPLRAQNRDARKGGRWAEGSKVLAERSWSAQCDATIAAACRVKSKGSKLRTARCPPHRWWTLSTDGASGGLRPRGLRPLIYPPAGGDQWALPAGVIGRTTYLLLTYLRTTSASLVSLRRGGITRLPTRRPVVPRVVPDV